MRVLYIARHSQPNADDEGAIADALKFLGHEVICLPEQTKRMQYEWPKCDLVLFHKWDEPDALKQFDCPKAFWYFDLVDFPDPTLAKRCQQRKDWMARTIPLVDVGFCTDGDWCKTSDKLVWLPQGADQRIVGRGDPKGQQSVDIIFVGDQKGGKVRESFHAEMTHHYGAKYANVRSGLYRERLANRIAAVKIVVAPDGPITPYYWSNRVYNVLGFGAFLIHPNCEVSKQYRDGEEIVLYSSRYTLHDLIDYYLNDPKARERISEAGLERTKAQHTYVHRCIRLIEVVRERCGL